MPDTNGDIPLTGDPRVDAALKRIRGKFQDLEHAILVQVALEKKMSERIKEHAELLVRIETNLAEVTDKLNRMIGCEMRREGGPEV